MMLLAKTSQLIPEIWLKQSFAFLAPEYVMAAGILLVLLFTILTGRKTSAENTAVMGVSLVTIFAAIYFIWPTIPLDFDGAKVQNVSNLALFGSIKMDMLSALGRLLILVGTGISILISHFYLSALEDFSYTQLLNCRTSAINSLFD